MPSIKCSFCDKSLVKSETKNCGSCKAVVYCSRECQKESWRNDHKAVCIRISNPQNANDELRLWCTFWAPSLLYVTVWALDILNNPGQNTKYALMIFLKRTESTIPSRRLKIIRHGFVPLSSPKLIYESKTAPGSFYLSIQDPVADDGFGIQFRCPAPEIFPFMQSKADVAKLAKLAVPILRHLTETVSHVDAMTMWDPEVWLGRDHPLVKPEVTLAIPEGLSHLL